METGGMVPDFAAPCVVEVRFQLLPRYRGLEVKTRMTSSPVDNASTPKVNAVPPVVPLYPCTIDSPTARFSCRSHLEATFFLLKIHF